MCQEHYTRATAERRKQQKVCAADCTPGLSAGSARAVGVVTAHIEQQLRVLAGRQRNPLRQRSRHAMGSAITGAASDCRWTRRESSGRRGDRLGQELAGVAS
jgi:hypothetical protein